MNTSVHGQEPQGFVTGVMSTLVSQIGVLLLSTATSVLAARALGPAGKGIVSMAMLVPSFAVVFLGLGVPVSQTYFVGKRTHTVPVALGNGLALTGMLVLVATPVYLLALPVLTDTVARGTPISLLLIAGLTVPLGLLFSHLMSIILGLQRIHARNVVMLCQKLVVLLAMAGFLVGLRLQEAGAVWAYVCGYLIALGAALAILSRTTRGRLVWKAYALKQVVSLGLRAYPASIFRLFNLRLDMFLVNYFTNVSQVGLYSTAVALAEILWYLPNASATVLFPRTAAAADRRTVKEFTPVVCRSTLLLTFAGALIVWALGKPLVLLLFSTPYSGAVEPLRLLLPGIVAVSAGKVLYADLSGRGLPQYASYSNMLLLGVTVLADMVLIPRFGISGAAAASSMAYASALVLALLAYIRVSGNSVTAVLIPRMSDLVLLAHLPSRAKGLLRRAVRRA